MLQPLVLTYDVFVDVIEKLRLAKSMVCCCILHVKNAPDMVDHEQLLMKLKQYGIIADAFDWFRSKVSKQYHIVKVSDASPCWTATVYGVPQGSKLGPSLFIFHNIDLPNKHQHIIPYIFAHDTDLLSESISSFCLLNEKLFETSSWFC